jgi:hypothetical protein
LNGGTSPCGHRAARQKLQDLVSEKNMRASQILAAVGPRTMELASDAIRRQGDAVVAESLDHAFRLLGEHQFSLVIASVDFDESRMLDLLAHCGRLPSQERTPFLCVRTIPGLLPEHTYADIRKTANFFGARYVDLTHWIDSEGLQGAVNNFEGVVASLLRMPFPETAMRSGSAPLSRAGAGTARLARGNSFRR